jgi:hypothetical protein
LALVVEALRRAIDRARLDQLLVVPAGAQTTPLDRLRRARAYRAGDRVLQLKNDDDLKGCNGDLATIRSVDPTDQALLLDLDDGPRSWDRRQWSAAACWKAPTSPSGAVSSKRSRAASISSMWLYAQVRKLAITSVRPSPSGVSRYSTFGGTLA